MLKKIFVLLIIITATTLANYQDFTLFAQGKELFKEDKHLEAQEIFKDLLKNHPDSILFKSQYAQHYIGLNLFYLGYYSEAIELLKEAKYRPLELTEGSFFRSRRSDYFQYENEYYIARSYENLDNKEKAILYYEKLLKSYFEPDLEVYRRKALEQLMHYDSSYKIIYDAVFNNNYDDITKLDLEVLLNLGDYFFTRGFLNVSEDIYKFYLFRKESQEVERKLLETLTRQKKYNEVIRMTTEFLKKSNQDLYVFYLGNAHRRLGNFTLAIDILKKIEDDSRYYTEANHILGRLYLAIGNTNSALRHLEIANTWAAIELQASTYYRIGAEEDYEGLKSFINQRAWWDISAEYRYKLYKVEGDESYLRDIIRHNPNTYYYELAIDILEFEEGKDIYPIEELAKKYSDLHNLLDFLDEFDDSNLAKIAISQYNFDSNDNLYRIYLRIKNYIREENFYNALNLASRNQSNFYRYWNLRNFLYPQFYKEYVDKWSNEFGIEAALVYAIIRQESHFNTNVVSSASAYGLMQLIMPTAQGLNPNLTPEELLIPKSNIKYGTMYIARLLRDYNSIPTSLAAYNGGPGNLSRWKLDENGDIIIDSITFTETKKYVEKVMNNYMKYKRIYENN